MSSNMAAPPRPINSHGNNKRAFHQMEMAHSAPGNFDTSDWNASLTTYPQQQQHTSSAAAPVAAFAPNDFITRLESRNSSIDTSTAAKRPRVEGLDGLANHPPFSHHHHHGVHTYPYNVSPSTSNASSLSSPLSFAASSEVMSRQSSMTDASLLHGVDMLRVESDMSTCSGNVPFPIDGIDASFFSSMEGPSSSVAVTGLDDAASQLLSGMGYGFGVVQDFPYVESLPLNAVAYGGEQVGQWPTNEIYASQDMQRTSSDSSTSSTDSTSSTSTDHKATARRLKHLSNGTRPLASRSIPTGPLSINPATSKMRALKPQEPGTARKEPIPKTPYTRPHHDKLKCKLCDEYPEGFRGDHELRRHHERAHAQLRKVWICVDPQNVTEEGWRPQRPVDICKQCNMRKEYNVYYNAAAHLRRAHFRPRKRGRKARGEERESRAGKAGGDWPTIDWLKLHGWLKEIEVGGAEPSSPTSPIPADQLIDADEDDTFDLDDNDLTPPPPYEVALMENYHDNFSADMLGMSALPLTDDFIGYGYPTHMTIDPNMYNSCDTGYFSTEGLQAPPMQHAMSAPPALDGSGFIYPGMY